MPKLTKPLEIKAYTIADKLRDKLKPEERDDLQVLYTFIGMLFEEKVSIRGGA